MVQLFTPTYRKRRSSWAAELDTIPTEPQLEIIVELMGGDRLVVEHGRPRYEWSTKVPLANSVWALERRQWVEAVNYPLFACASAGRITERGLRVCLTCQVRNKS